MQTEIKRVITITVAGQGIVNQYGDMAFKATDGNEFKIGKKRSQFFALIQPGKTLKLSYSEYMGKEFIAEVAPAEPQTTPLPASRTQNQPVKQPEPSRTTTQQQNPPISGAEKGMIVGQIGLCFTNGIFTPENQPELWEYYKGEIRRVTGIRVH